MNELAQALRDFADRIEAGEVIPGATQCAIIVGDDEHNVNATYIGRLAPAHRAGISLMCAGIYRFNLEQPAAVVPGYLASGSTH
jgi:hypothetical protein